jgi:LytS/YehU family sensor histidine kinase
MIRVEEELTIVRAYLEIEELRLGGKLATEIDVDKSVLRVEIPILSIQPLVENAVKHGVASRPGVGFVRLSIRRSEARITVEVCNSGEFSEPPPARERKGVGLANVRRRLVLCYGSGSTVEVCGCLIQTPFTGESEAFTLRPRPVVLQYFNHGNQSC